MRFLLTKIEIYEQNIIYAFLNNETGLRSRVDDSYMDQSSYVMENSLGSDIEFATINRLMADFNINRDTTFAPKRSPLKMLKITGDSLNDFGSSSQNVRLEDAETTFNTAHTRVQGMFVHNKILFI